MAVEDGFSTDARSSVKPLKQKGLFEYSSVGYFKKSFKNKDLHNYDCI